MNLRDCKESPFKCEPEHPESAFIIDESSLFMVMYSDGLEKVLSTISMLKCNFKLFRRSSTIFHCFDLENDNEKPCEILAKMLINNIIHEETLNSAAQSVLDEVGFFTNNLNFVKANYFINK